MEQTLNVVITVFAVIGFLAYIVSIVHPIFQHMRDVRAGRLAQDLRELFRSRCLTHSFMFGLTMALLSGSVLDGIAVGILSLFVITRYCGQPESSETTSTTGPVSEPNAPNITKSNEESDNGVK